MEEGYNNPHDHFFKQTLAAPGLAAEFFRLYLPPPVVALLDTNRVEAVKGSFVDEELKEHFSDALYSVSLVNGQSAYIYILLEHKSAPDAWVALQILRYLVRFWDEQQKAGVKKLPLVLPVVFYHGRQRWKIADNFLSLFDFKENLAALRDYLPEFRYHLCDLSRYEDEDLIGTGRMASAFLLLKHIFRRSLKRLLPEALRRHIAGGTVSDDDREYVRTALIYLLQTSKVSGREFSAAFRQVLKERKLPMTENFIDRWINQGVRQGLSQGLTQGRQEGLAQEINLVLRQLKRRIGALDTRTETHIRELPIEKVEALGEALLDFQKASDLTAWLRQNVGKPRDTESLPN